GVIVDFARLRVALPLVISLCLGAWCWLECKIVNDSKCLITGVAGFIGSHLADRLLALGHRVVGVDNMVLGQRSNLADALSSPNFAFNELDVNDYDRCFSFIRAEFEKS